MHFNFDQVIPSLPFILEGVWVTLDYMIFAAFYGLILGSVLSLFRFSRFQILRLFAQFYTSIFRGTPLLVQLTLIYYCLPALTNGRLELSAYGAGILAFSLNSAAYISEIIRGSIQSIDRGQFEAFQSLGLSHTQGMLEVILPQALRRVLPNIVNEMVNLLKESSLVSVIGEMDLLRRANIISAEKYLPFEPLIIVTVIYYILVMMLTMLAKWIEKKVKD